MLELQMWTLQSGADVFIGQVSKRTSMSNSTVSSLGAAVAPAAVYTPDPPKVAPAAAAAVNNIGAAVNVTLSNVTSAVAPASK